MDGSQDSTTKLEALHQKPHFLISLPSLLMGDNYPTDCIAINPHYGTFLRPNHIAISYINFRIPISYVDLI